MACSKQAGEQTSKQAGERRGGMPELCDRRRSGGRRDGGMNAGELGRRKVGGGWIRK